MTIIWAEIRVHFPRGNKNINNLHLFGNNMKGERRVLSDSYMKSTELVNILELNDNTI